MLCNFFDDFIVGLSLFGLGHYADGYFVSDNLYKIFAKLYADTVFHWVLDIHSENILGKQADGVSDADGNGDYDDINCYPADNAYSRYESEKI